MSASRQVNSHQVNGEQLKLLQNGAAYFPQLCADIDAAQHSIYMETYIFAADETGRMVADALQRVALPSFATRRRRPQKSGGSKVADNAATNRPARFGRPANDRARAYAAFKAAVEIRCAGPRTQIRPRRMPR